MTSVISNETLYKSFLLGAKYVISEKDTLNSINVFPVADGDTGSNLTSLMKSILLKARLEETLEKTAKSISDAAIVGARGNSGIIFASYIYGFSDSIKGDSVDLDTFINSMSNASKTAYASIETPVEGTMITLMRMWYEILFEVKDKASDLVGLLTKAFERMKKELERTTELLQVLKDNKVVDAGAKGFYHFLDGFIRGFKGEDIDVDMKETPEEFHLHVNHFDAAQNRYCTEVLFEGKDMDLEGIKKLLMPFGDSLVVAGHKDLARIHIHTDVPAKIFELIEPLGLIVDQKVDDMKKQFDVANHRKHKIALVTDSIADLPDNYAEDNQIHVLNLSLLINQVTYYDKLTIENARFYKLMKELKSYPSSSLPNPKTIENLFSFLTTYYDEIIVITVSSKMSGTYQAFQMGKKAFPDKKITVIDSITNSVAEGLLVKRAMTGIEQGMKYEDIIEDIEKHKKLTKILVSVKTLKYMIRSGRVKKTTGIVGKLINLKPIISIDGEGMGIIAAKAFSQGKSDKLVFEDVKNAVATSGIYSYALVHVNALERAEHYALELEKITGMKPDYVSEISTIVAMNAGIGSVAVAYTKKS